MTESGASTGYLAARGYETTMGKQSRKKRERRVIKMNDETAKAVEEQLERFRAKFGREPGPGDPLFFDPDHPTPRRLQVEPMEAEMVATMKRANIRPEIIHAYERTGRIVSESNKHLLTKEDLAEWEDAIDEYFEQNPQSDA